MEIVIVRGILTEDGKILLDLPENWRPGEIEVKLFVEAVWTDDELKHMLKFEVKTVGEIMDAGLVGAGADWQIGDSAEWVEEQRRRRRDRRTKSWTA